MLNGSTLYTITDEPSKKYHTGFINEDFLMQNIDDFSKHFYLCGPPKMVEALQNLLITLGASPDTVVFEK